LLNLLPGHQKRYNYHHPGAGPVIPFVPQKPVVEGFLNDDVVGMLKNAAGKCDPCELGRALHALQDSYSHGGTFTDENFNPITDANGRIVRVPPDLGGHPKGRPLHGPGEGQVSGGVLDTRVDDPRYDFARYQAALDDTRKALGDFRKACSCPKK
jgi:hypothetical protein